MEEKKINIKLTADELRVITHKLTLIATDKEMNENNSIFKKCLNKLTKANIEQHLREI